MSRGKPKQRDALLQHLLETRPAGGEDYFAFAIVTDASEPTWDQRLSFAGTYKQAARLCVAALGAMAQIGSLQKGARIVLYQGYKARAYLAEAAVQEARYQHERKGTPNN